MKYNFLFSFVIIVILDAQWPSVNNNLLKGKQ